MSKWKKILEKTISRWVKTRKEFDSWELSNIIGRELTDAEEFPLEREMIELAEQLSKPHGFTAEETTMPHQIDEAVRVKITVFKQTNQA